MTKISLSAEEMQLLCNPGWILTKQRIIEKVYMLFGNLSEKMQAQLANKENFPQALLQLPPKISKGEQYESLPYVVLDYPRVFSKDNVFAVRTFFWWGNYFSITLHLKGIFLQQRKNNILLALGNEKWKAYYLSAEGNEFSFNLAGKNYRQNEVAVPLRGIAFNEIPFLKISGKILFSQWDAAEQLIMESFDRFVGLESKA